MSADAAERADRLGAAMLVCGLVREPAVAALEATARLPLLSQDGWDAWRALDDEDLALAHACLETEYALRARQWDALERLGAAWASAHGANTEERVASMPVEEVRAALTSAFTLGWQYPAPLDQP